MNLAEAAKNRELLARTYTLEQDIALLKRQVADLTRRVDDQSKAHRVIADDVQKTRETLSLKKHG